MVGRVVILLWTLGWALVACEQPDEIAKLIRQLEKDDPQAALRLSKIHDDPRLLRPFARLLASKESYLRGRAVHWFGKVGPKARGAAPWLAQMARGQRPEDLLGARGEALESPQQTAAIESLAHIGGPRASDTLCDLLFSKRRVIQRAAEKALEQLGPAALPALVPRMAHEHATKGHEIAEHLVLRLRKTALTELITAAETPYYVSRLTLVRELGAILEPQVTAFLLQRLSDPHWKIRQMALQRLGLPKRKLDRTALSALRGKLADEDIDVRTQAAVALTNHPDPGAEEALLKLYRWTPPAAAYASSYKLTSQRRTAALALAKIRSARGFESILERFKKQPAEPEAAGLGAYGDPRALQALAAALPGSQDEWLRTAIVRALGALGTTKAVPILVKAYQDPNWMVRQAAVEALASLRDPRVVDALVQALNDTEKRVYMAALRGLHKLASEKVLKPVCAFMRAGNSKQDELREAATVLQATGHPDATPCLLAALERLTRIDKNRGWVQPIDWEAVYEALGAVGDERAIEPLLARLRPLPKPVQPAPGKVAAPLHRDPAETALEGIARRLPKLAPRIQKALKERQR